MSDIDTTDHRIRGYSLLLAGAPLCWAVLWPRLQGLYPEAQTIQAFLGVTAILTAVIAFWGKLLPRNSHWMLWGALAVLALCWVCNLHHFYLIPAILLAVGASLTTIGKAGSSPCRAFGYAFLYNGTIAAFQYAMLPLVEKFWVAGRYQTGLMGQFSALLLSFVTDTHMLPNGNMYVRGVDYVWEFQTYFESCGFQVHLTPSFRHKPQTPAPRFAKVATGPFSGRQA